MPFYPALLSTYSSICWMPRSVARLLVVRQKPHVHVLVLLFLMLKALMLALHLAQ
jgi:hypothetical protein